MGSTLLVIVVAILSIILWHKKINPNTTWAYALYVIIIVIIYLFAVIAL